jgi:hypothetical protein
MALPDFLVIGAPKAGTTALHAALAAHPGLYLSAMPVGHLRRGSQGFQPRAKRARSRRPQPCKSNLSRDTLARDVTGP